MRWSWDGFRCASDIPLQPRMSQLDDIAEARGPSKEFQEGSWNVLFVKGEEVEPPVDADRRPGHGRASPIRQYLVFLGIGPIK